MKRILENHEMALACALTLLSALVIAVVWFPIAATSYDEICYTDPAARFVLGKGFTSASWYAQGPETLWSSNVPLQQFFLVLWFTAFGFSQTVAQFANSFYVVVANIIVMAAIRQGELIESAQWRLGFLVAFLASDVPLGLSTNGRPDALCFLIAASALWGTTDRNRKRGLAVLGAASALAPWASLSLAAAFAFFGVAAIVILQKRAIPAVLTVVAGGFVGTALLVSFYLIHGTMGIFLDSIRGHTAANQAANSFRANLSFRAGGVIGNTTLYLFGTCGIVAIASGILARVRGNDALRILFLVTLLVFPVFMVSIGVFHGYYRWLIIFPLCLLLFALISRCEVKGRFSWTIVILILSASAFVSTAHIRKIPWAFRVRELREANKAEFEKFATRNLSRSDIAVVEAKFWYTAVTVASTTYSAWYPGVMSNTVANASTVLLLTETKTPSDCETISFFDFSKKLDKAWKPIGKPLQLRENTESPTSVFYHTYRAVSQ